MDAVQNDWRHSYTVAVALRRLMEIMIGVLPAFGIAYLHFFQDPLLRFESHLFHELAIALSTLIGAAISYISWRCYLQSGERFVKWLTRGFIGFTLVYSLHGFFTPVAHQNLWLFILYGPASRLLMAACLLIGILNFGRPADPPAVRADPRQWLIWAAFCVGVNLAVAGLAHSPVAGASWLRFSQEIASTLCCAASLLVLSRLRARSSLMGYYTLALAYFGMSSLAFIDGRVWNHQWWQAHAIFAVGFCLLGYGVLRAYLTAHSFERVFSEKELLDDLVESNRKLQEAAEQIGAMNLALEKQVQAVQAVRAEFESLFNLSPDGILVVGSGGEILRSNERAAQMFGYPAEAMTGLRVESLMPASLRQAHAAKRALFEYSPMARSMSGGNRAFECLRRDGSTFHAAISLCSLVFEGRECVAAFIRDITELLSGELERRTAMQAGAGHAALLELLTADEADMVFQFRRRANGQFEYTFASNGASRLLECSPSQLVGQPGGLFTRVLPADLPGLIASLERSAAQMSPWQATWRVHLPRQGTAMRSAECAAPLRQPDGSLLWSGRMKAAPEPIAA